MEEKFIRFLLDHADDDPERLLLSAGRWPGVDVRRAARILEARRKLRGKVPSWVAHPGLDYPDSLPLEQCSSEETARYKQQFVPEGCRFADLTGGLGVDCWFLSRKAGEAHYCERQEALCAIARHNFDVLEDRPGFHIDVHPGDGISWLSGQSGTFDLLYLDPARRNQAARRVYDIADCEPDLLQIKDLLLEKAGRVLAKISPMADISRTLALLPRTSELHVVEVSGEVKELLLLMDPSHTGEPLVTATDTVSALRFTPSEEASARVFFAGGVGRFLFQPSRAVRKAGAFRLVSQRFALAKLAPSTHLYTGDEACDAFPGKRFEVLEAIPWSKEALRSLARRHPRLEMTALNFPLDTEALRRRSGIAAGGELHLFATSLHDKSKILILCKPCEKTTPR